MHRLRRVLALLIGLVSAPLHAAVLPADQWQDYRALFVSPDGRIVDTGNQGVSHSEGQGYGLLLALAAENRADFERIWNWTRSNLQRQDKLFAWQWSPRLDPPVKDWNNATDGDLLIAWALARAAAHWQVPQWQDEARTIAVRLRGTLLREAPFGPLLLPGQQGFEEKGNLLVNPAYWVYPALAELARIDPEGSWEAVSQSGQRLLRLTRYGAAGVPPDWIRLHADGRLALPAESAQRRLGFEAIRVPLYLCWAGLRDNALLEGFLRAWPDEGAPAWIDLSNSDRAAYPLTLSQRAMRQLVIDCRQDRPTQALRLSADDYYGSTLTLLAQLALARPKSLP
ncbi:MAG: glycosyl hydrolase family 8 [Halothiobacillaceae bacterium]|jgi:endoglucanase|nr:glycosyl hydrolase family 8 [Halothiobacillaceae bacterium]